MGVGGIFQKFKVVLPAERDKLGDLAENASKMHSNDGLRLRCNCLPDTGGVDIERLRFGIDKHWRRTHARYGSRGRDEGNGRNNHLISWPDAEYRESHFERHGAVHRGHAELTVLIRREAALKLRYKRMKATPLRAINHV